MQLQGPSDNHPKEKTFSPGRRVAQASTGEVIIVTGASSGIGEATARLFGQRGYRVVLAARRQERLEIIAREIRQGGGQALPLPTDVTVLEDIQNLVEETLAHFGQVDLLFNNAGFGRLDWLETLDPVRDIERQFRVNLLGVILTTRAVLPHMIDRRCGHIINMSSVAGLVGTPTYTIYAASKFGVRGFSEALRREVRAWGIHVSAIYPGSVETEFRQHAGIHRKTGLSTPRRLRLTAQDVARVVFRMAQNPRPTTVIPWPLRISVWMNTLFPGLLDRLMEQRFVRRERDI